jgi:hypothetical protein
MFFNLFNTSLINFLTSLDLWYLPKKLVFKSFTDHSSGFFVGPDEKFGDFGFLSFGKIIIDKIMEK